MSSGERSPKRQRLEGYSPASPLPTFDTKSFIPPQTPPPSVRMSPSWTTQSLTAGQQQQQQQTGNASSTGGGGGGTSGTTFPTPPSTSGLHSHMTGYGGTDSARQTPLGDDEMDVRRDDDNRRQDRDGDAEMTGVQAVDTEHRRTDHEREEKSRDSVAPSLTAPAPKSTLASTAPPLPGAGVLYRLRTAPIAPSQPHPTQDLFQLYDLKRIQASVARKDPVTGEKINVMRKSYANKVKALGLEGRNKAESNLHELEGLLDVGWSQLVDGNRTMWEAHWEGQNMVLGNAGHENEILRKLDAALKMEPGKLPKKEHDQWKNMLGLDDSAATAGAVKGAPSKLPAASALSKTAPAMAARNSAPASPRGTIRPDRSGKKRRYNDSSFEGYDQEDDGHLSAGLDDTGRRVSGSKRQKRQVS